MTSTRCFPNSRDLPATHYFVGLDLGQVRDHTAIAVLERSVILLGRNYETWGWNTHTRRSFRHLERLPLGMPYPEMVEYVRQIVSRPEIAGLCTLIVDATGVGRAVVDLLRNARLPCRLMPVTIVGGDRESSDNGQWRVPKRDLISGLIVLFQTENLDICGHLRESQTLLKELGDMRVKVSLEGNETYGAWREGEHDDLVLAAALACWQGQREA